ncbi:CcdB family protein [Roseovarius sp. 2305UL8-3]|uniref:CcdB family protein n=1 Tax=Roseovarius conchicola TaxID=3121636 RepID=UPI003528B926
MAKYDVHAFPSGDGLLLDVQAELLDHLITRVVVPLLPKATAPQPAARLNPVFEINGEAYVMVPQFLAAVPRSALGDVVSNLEPEFAQITAALDMVFQGF